MTLTPTQITLTAAALALVGGLYLLPRASVQQRAAAADSAKATAPAMANRDKPSGGAVSESPATQAADEGADASKEVAAPHAALDMAETKVLASLKDALRSAPEARKPLLADSLARRYSRKGLFDSAARYREVALAAAPTEERMLATAEAYYNAFSVAPQPAKAKPSATRAEALYKQAIAKNPHQLEAKTHLAMLYAAGPQPMEGIMLLRQVLAEDPDNEQALYNLGTLSIQSGQYDKASERFNALLAHHPGNTRARFYLGLSLKELGRKAEARKELERVRAAEPDPAVQAAVADLLAELNS